MLLSSPYSILFSVFYTLFLVLLLVISFLVLFFLRQFHHVGDCLIFELPARSSQYYWNFNSSLPLFQKHFQQSVHSVVYAILGSGMFSRERPLTASALVHDFGYIYSGHLLACVFFVLLGLHAPLCQLLHLPVDILGNFTNTLNVTCRIHDGSFFWKSFRMNVEIALNMLL